MRDATIVKILEDRIMEKKYCLGCTEAMRTMSMMFREVVVTLKTR